MADYICTNSWDAARSLDVRRGGSSFDLLVDSTAEQLERAGHLFRKGLREKGSAASGFANIFNDTHALVREEVRNSGVLTQVISGAALGVAKIFGSMPFAIVDYSGKIIDQSPKGPSQMAATMIVEGVKGIVAGGVHIVGGIGDLITGELNGQGIFDISFKVSEITSGAAVMIAGAVYAVKGAATVADSMSCSVGGSTGGGAIALMPSLAVADAGAMVSGAGMFGGGIISMSSAGGIDQGSPFGQVKKKWTNDELADVLEEVKGNRLKAAERTGIERHTIKDRINESADGSRLSKWKDIKGRQKKVVTEDELLRALEETGGSRNAAAKKLGIDRHEVKKMIDGSVAESQLAKFKTIKAKRGPKGKVVTEDAVADALEKTGGSRKAAAKKLGIDGHKVKKMIDAAGVDSRLAKFKTIKGKSGPKEDDHCFNFNYIERAPGRMTLEEVEGLGPPAEL